jgi:hypothetical protein
MPKRSFLSRIPCQDFKDVRESYAEQESQDMQGAIESPHRGRSYLEKGRRVEGRVSKFFSDPSESRGRDSF